MAWNPTYKISLLDLTNRVYTESVQRRNVRALLSNSDFRRVFGNAVIDEIKDRTINQNIDKNGRALLGYSPAYKASLAFSVYGKSASNVNLKLTGEMMASLRPKGNTQELVIQLEGQNNRDKAEGHVSGRYGRSNIIRRRDFLGLPKSIEEKLFKETVRDFSSDIPDVEIEFFAQVGNQPGTTIALTALDLLE